MKEIECSRKGEVEKVGSLLMFSLFWLLLQCFKKFCFNSFWFWPCVSLDLELSTQIGEIFAPSRTFSLMTGLIANQTSS